ncbi:MAG: hypothetical protein H6502_04160 [Candidatus Woesearchaeota archaeon]|nr:MAG: hypothetical protein H6502_04160 [Candidatus Woesearchaeota archaeon]
MGKKLTFGLTQENKFMLSVIGIVVLLLVPFIIHASLVEQLIIVLFVFLEAINIFVVAKNKFYVLSRRFEVTLFVVFIITAYTMNVHELTRPFYLWLSVYYFVLNLFDWDETKRS